MSGLTDALLDIIERINSSEEEKKKATLTLCQGIGVGKAGVPDLSISLALMCAVKSRPLLFRNTTILPIILSWLRVPEDIRFATRGLLLYHRLACNVLLCAYRDCKEWPLEFLQAYMDDALGPRAWVEDQAGCKAFIDNLRTCWNPHAAVAALRGEGAGGGPEESPLLGGGSMKLGGDDRSVCSSVQGTPVMEASRPPTAMADIPLLSLPPGALSATSFSRDSDSDSGDEEVLEEAIVGGNESTPLPSSSGDLSVPATAQPEEVLPLICPHYSQSLDMAHNIIITSLRNRMESAATHYHSLWQVIASMIELATLGPCRLLASQNIQRWLETPAQSKNARALLTAIVRAVDPNTPDDEQLVETLLHLKLPAQQSILFVESMAILVQKAPRFLRQALSSFLGDAATSARSDAQKTLAQILQQALTSADARRQGRSQWLNREEVGRELARAMKEQMVQRPGPKIREAFITFIKTLTLDNVGLLPLVREMLSLPPHLLTTLGHRWTEYLKTVSDSITDLLKYRAQVCLDVGKAWNEQHSRQKGRDGTTSQEELASQKHYEQWRLRLLAMKDISEIHADAARFSVQVSKEVLSLIPILLPGEGGGGGGSKKEQQQQQQYDGLSIFRSMLLLHQQVDKNDKSPETFLCRYVGVRDTTCRKLVGLTRLKMGYPGGRDGPQLVLDQLEDLIRRAAKMVIRREQDQLVRKAVWENLSNVELYFPDARIIQELFSLARYDPSADLLSRRGLNASQVPPLARVEFFWRVALLLLIISGSNPQSVGGWLWSSCPTLRCLMQMVVCNQYQFPPPGAVIKVQPTSNGARKLKLGVEEGGAAVDIMMIEATTRPMSPHGNVPRSLEEQVVEADAEIANEEAALTSLLRGQHHRTIKKRKKESTGGRRVSHQAPAGSAVRGKDQRLSLDGFREGDRDEVVDDNMGGPRLSRSLKDEGGGGGSSGKKSSAAVGVPEVIFLDLGMAPRKPPPHVLQQLIALDEEFGIGARLRRSIHPDFVAAAIAGDDSKAVSRHMLETTMEWLAPAVAAEPDVTMKRLPLGCICHMLMMAHTTQLTAKKESSTAPPLTSPEQQQQPVPPSATGSSPIPASSSDVGAMSIGGVVTAAAENSSQGGAADLALLKLMDPLRETVLKCLSPTKDGEKPENVQIALDALSVFLEELQASSLQRRIAARKALEGLIAAASSSSPPLHQNGGVGGGGDSMEVCDTDGNEEGKGKRGMKKRAAGVRALVAQPDFQAQAREDSCSWVFRLDALPSFHVNPAPILRGLYEGLHVEGSQSVISYYLMALYYHCHGPAAQTGSFQVRTSTPPPTTILTTAPKPELSGPVCSPSFFSFAASSVLSSRKLVIQATMQHVPHLRDLIMDEIRATLDESAEGGRAEKAGDSHHRKPRIWQSDEQVRMLLPKGDGGSKEAILPMTLLAACLAVLRMHKEADLPPALAGLLALLFPPPKQGEGGAAASKEKGRELGVKGARKMGEREEAALYADDWMQLAKCECPVVSGASARCMPALLLPRLLLCSGLSHECFAAALARTDELGKHDASGEVYRDLLAPASTGSWGMARALGPRRILIRKLARRVTAYINLHMPEQRGKEPTKGTFLAWLANEVKGTAAAVTTPAAEKKKSARAIKEGSNNKAPAKAKTTTNAALLFTSTSLLEATEELSSHHRSIVARVGRQQGGHLEKGRGTTSSTAPAASATSKEMAVSVLLSLASKETVGKPAVEESQPPPLPPLSSDDEKAIASALGEGDKWSNVDQIIKIFEIGFDLGNVVLVRHALRKLDLSSSSSSSPANQADHGGGNEIEVDVESKALQMLGVLKGRVSKVLPPSSSSAPVLEGVLRLTAAFLSDVCRLFWTTDTHDLGPYCRNLIWQLLVEGGSGEELYWTPVFKLTLLSSVLHTFFISQLQYLVRRLIDEGPSSFVRHGEASEAGEEKEKASFDIWSALGLLQRWFRHAGRGPMVSEVGVLAGTNLAMASLPQSSSRHQCSSSTSPFKRPVAGGGGGGGQATNTLAIHSKNNQRLGSFVNLSAEDVNKVLICLVQGLRLSRSPSKSPSVGGMYELIATLCLHLAARNSFFRGRSIRHFANLAAAVVPRSHQAFLTTAGSSPSMMDTNEEGNGVDQGGEAYVLFRLYMTYPSEMAFAMRTQRLDVTQVIHVLCRGQALSHGPLFCPVERRLPDDIAHLCRLGHDQVRDAEAVNALIDLAHRHPFLILRHLRSFTEILRADASPRSARPYLPPPFYLPTSSFSSSNTASRMLPPPPATSSSGGSSMGGPSTPAGGGHSISSNLPILQVMMPNPHGTEGEMKAVRLRFVFWGSSFHAHLWQTLLNVVMEIPASAIAAYVEEEEEGGGQQSRSQAAAAAAGEAGEEHDILTFCGLYIRLLATQQQQGAPLSSAASTSTGAGGSGSGSKGGGSGNKHLPIQFQDEEDCRALAVMAERLLTLLNALEGFTPQAVLAFLQTPLPQVGALPFDVLKEKLSSSSSYHASSGAAAGAGGGGGFGGHGGGLLMMTPTKHNTLA